MLNHLHHRSGVIARQSFVTIGQGALRERQTGLLGGRQAIQLEALTGYLQHTMGDVQAHNAVKSPVVEERFEELPFATAQVEYPCCTTALQRGHHGTQALLIQAERRLNSRFFLIVHCGQTIWV